MTDRFKIIPNMATPIKNGGHVFADVGKRRCSRRLWAALDVFQGGEDADELVEEGGARICQPQSTTGGGVTLTLPTSEEEIHMRQAAKMLSADQLDIVRKGRLETGDGPWRQQVRVLPLKLHHVMYAAVRATLSVSTA